MSETKPSRQVTYPDLVGTYKTSLACKRQNESWYRLQSQLIITDASHKYPFHYSFCFTVEENGKVIFSSDSLASAIRAFNIIESITIITVLSDKLVGEHWL